MKFFKFFTMMVVASAMMALNTSCDSDDDDNPLSGSDKDSSSTGTGSITLSTPSLSFDVYGSEKTLYITATAAWEATCSDSWLSVNPSFATGTSSVKVTAASNYVAEGSDARTGYVTFSLSSGGGDVVLDITQDGNDYDPTTYWYTEDWEWFDAWTIKGGSSGPAGDCMGTNDSGAYAPNFTSCVIDGVSLLDKWVDMGYTLIGQTPDGPLQENGAWPSPTTDELCVYVQMNYPKLGKTGYQGGIICPPFTNIPPESAYLRMSFDWGPFRDTDGTIDEVHPIVVFETDGAEIVLKVDTVNWETGHAMEWIPVNFDLTGNGVKITKDTKLTFRTDDDEWGVKTRHRWLLDNIKIYTNENNN